MFKKLSPNLMVNNVQETVKYYIEILEFDFVMGVVNESNEIIMENGYDKNLIYALVKTSNIELMFQERNSLANDVSSFAEQNPNATMTLYFEVEDVDALYDKIKNKVKIIKDINTTWYNMREFYISDPNGYILTFATQK